MKYFLGVDVGTSSVRVGLFDENGKLIDFKTKPINVFNLKVDFYEQSSDEIWSAVCNCIRNIISDNCSKQNGINTNDIAAIGFDATCSLVVLDEHFKPVTVSPTGDDSINIIMWMDHRSNEEADFINSINNECLKSVGGKISIEMDPPKILWLKKNFYEKSYSRAAYFFSLPDYLVFKFTNTDIRSVCTTTCKWLYKSSPNTNEWDAKFWNEIGLNDLTLSNFKKIGAQVKNPFSYIDCLKISAETVSLTGLSENVKAGVSMIDAHAGGVGGLAVTLSYLAKQTTIQPVSINEVLVLVSGTSSCLMATTESPKYIDSVWGPYYSAMVPNHWLNEAGQSASGKLIDYLIQTHPAYEELKKTCHDENIESIYAKLNSLIVKIGASKGFDEKNLSKLTENVHIYPDFHGNRSPLADPRMTGAICGLKFDATIDNLALLYLACLQSLAYQTKHILNVMKDHEVNLRIITIIGGLAINKFYCQLVSDVCGMPVLIPEKSESIVILGSAILGASNYEDYKSFLFGDLIKRFGASNQPGMLMPNNNLDKYHERKYNVYLSMLNDQLKYRRIMQNE